MCISNEMIREILKTNRNRRNARIRYALTVKDGNNQLIWPTREDAVKREINYPFYRTEITYEDAIGPDAWKINYMYWHGEKPDITKTRCPIPYMPAMPLTRCLTCTNPLRRA